MTILALVAGVQLTAAASGLPLQASAVPSAPAVVVDDTDGPLSLEATFAPGMDRMTPGDSTDWTVTAMLNDNLSGTLSVRVVSEGELAEHSDGAHLLLRRCSEPWEGRTCPGGADTVIDAPLLTLDPETTHTAGSVTAPRGPYFLATIGLPENMPDELQSTHLAIGLGFTALGDEEMAGTPLFSDADAGTLPDTGSSPFASILAIGLIALLAGIGVRMGSRGASWEPQ